MSFEYAIEIKKLKNINAKSGIVWLLAQYVPQ